MPRRSDADRGMAQAPRFGAAGSRPVLVAGGFALAVLATLAVFLTDNPQYLRVAVVAVAWAFVLATFAAGRRGGDRAEAAVREAELRRAYEVELEREVSARREYELELENELRRETEDSVRGELDALRGDIAALAGLRDEVARVSALRGDIAALNGLKDEVARVAALHDDVRALNSLRQELGQLAELRADMGRLRAELTEQLSSEMLVERIVMRTQASRLPGESDRTVTGRTLEGAASWTDDVPPRELTGGWPAIRLDEPRETQQFEQVRIDRTVARPPVPAAEPAPTWQFREPAPAESAAESPSWHTRSSESPSWEPSSWETPRTGLWPAAPLPPSAPVTSALPAPGAPPAAVPPPVFSPPLPAPPAADRWSPSPEPDLSPRRSRHSAGDSAADSARDMVAPPPPTAAFPMSPPAPSEPPPSPLDWLASRSLLDEPAAAPAPSPVARPAVPPRRRRSDDAVGEPVPNESAPTTQRPAVRPSPLPRNTPSTAATPRPEFDRSAFRFAVRDEEPATAAAPNPALARILDENGVTPPTGGRRRRRYRDDGESDDVLARVLRGE
ncbi:hypothetical protein GCM10010531_41980 [Blastococcus jejuensis]|uniref:DUF6779 domain-containing protein n=1 Tax=Blastococcus jejuensis TaxID=351224 RepID=A0ABP6PM96_9ACTN